MGPSVKRYALSSELGQAAPRNSLARVLDRVWPAKIPPLSSSPPLRAPGVLAQPAPGAFATAIVCPLAVALPAGFPMAILATDPKREDFLDTPPRDGCSSHW